MGRRPGKRLDAERRQPSSQEQDRGHRADQDHVAVFAEIEQGEGHCRILDEVAGDQFRLAFRQIEWRPVRLRERRNEEDDSHRQQRQHEPDMALRHDDVGQVQRPSAKQHGYQHETDRDFVRDHLRRRAQRAQKGVSRVRGPTGHDDAVDPQRTDREQIEDPNIDVGILYLFAISSLGVYGIIMAGWASNSRYAFLGALRSAAQMVSYEVSIGFVLVTVLLCAGSLNLTDIVMAQRHVWFVLPLLPMAVIFFISALAETNRAPFDLPEGESELVAGYFVEYSAMAFALFYLGEYGNMILVSAMTTILFLGGWLPPFGIEPFSGP